MKARRFASALLILALALASALPASARPGSNPPDEAPEYAPLRQVDLATQTADRWIVQLKDAPLAKYRGGIPGLPPTAIEDTGDDHLDTQSAGSQAYLNHAHAQQRNFEGELARVAPGAQTQRNYRVALNGLSVKMSNAEAAAVRQLPGVRAVTPDIPVHLHMYGTPEQIGAPELWAKVGGQSHGGEGVKVAIIDGGIYLTRDAGGAYAGNPCFDDTGYSNPPAGYPKGDTRFTNKKVLVARAYFRRDDPPTAGNDTPIPGPDSTSHGTHVAGTVACNAGTQVTYQGANVTLSGIAPRAYLMNYRVFYPSTSPEAFQNGNAYVSELVQAIEDAVSDGADVISNSWGSSYQNTLAWPDPMIQAAEAAVDAGVVMVFANGNEGDRATAISPAISPKVIGVGAVTKNKSIVPGVVDVTAPAPVPDTLKQLAVGPALFGPTVTTRTGPALYVPAERVATGGSPLGCSVAGDNSPYPAGALAGKIALIGRGVCQFSEKVFNAQRAGAVAAIVYNSASGGDNLQSMGPGTHAADVTIPSWFMRRSQGLAMRDFANAHTADAQAQFTYAPRTTTNIGDVMAGFSSRGPSSDKLLKPDLVAPGVDVLSAGYGGGAFPRPYTGFGAVSGTSMATPHVAGAAALLKQLHPRWKPWQVKSALMSTANEEVFLNTTRTSRAGLLDRGAGRIDLAKAANPELLLDQPSLSAGELPAGQGVTFTLRTQDITGDDKTWTATVTKSGSPATAANFSIKVDRPVFTAEGHDRTKLSVRVESVPGAAPGDYEGGLVLTSNATGQRLHVPVWLRVVPTTRTADVLLVNDDGHSLDRRFKDYSSYYKATLDGLGVSYRYLDVGTQDFASLNELFGYKAVLIFTGDNDSFDTSGFDVAGLNRLHEWLDSGGRLWVTGQNAADVYTTGGNAPSSPRLGRGRLYNGYLGLEFDTQSVYPGAAPRPTASGAGPMADLRLDLSPGADGGGNQKSIDAALAIGDTDTYAAPDSTATIFRQIGGTTVKRGAAIGFARSSEPSLDEQRQKFRYRSLSMGFGLEGINDTTGASTRQQVARRALDWLSDSISLAFNPDTRSSEGRVTVSVRASSSVAATFTSFRWDFGDGPIVTTTVPSVSHRLQGDDRSAVRVEATDSLGHRAVITRGVPGGDDGNRGE
jgi:subtilisin family serine protease